MSRIFIYGHPGLYGGAGTELHHQIYIWKSFYELEIHIIPTDQGYQNEPLYQEMLNLGVTYHDPHDFTQLTEQDSIISFCGGMFLDNLSHINRHTRKTIFVNCMTWIHEPKEKQAHEKNQIAFSLYQRPQILEEHEKTLRLQGSDAQFLHFIPYFYGDDFKFQPSEHSTYRMGRISRIDLDKFSKNSMEIWEGVLSPLPKEGIILGFNEKVRTHLGSVPSWVRTYKNHTEYSVKSFYEFVDVIVQSSDTTENWPRIGFEAMYSGKPLIVDNRGGWKYMIDHKKTGFLCNHNRDFAYYASLLAYEPELRHEIAQAAYQKAKELSSFEASRESWNRIFERVYA